MDFLLVARRCAARLVRLAALGGSCAAALALVACGPVGSGGTGAPAGAAAASFAQGPINGFGSILVNGVHYDDTTALVVDDDGRVLSAQADLHLGSVVEVQGEGAPTDVIAAALIRVHTDLVGPVTTTYDPLTRWMRVLGQPVAVDPATTFVDGIEGGLERLAPGAVVEVASVYEPVAGIYRATRIAPRPDAAAYAIRGAVTALGAGSLEIGGQSFDYGSLAIPADFQIGQLVRLTLATEPTALGHWTVTAIASGATPPPDHSMGDLRGAVGKVLDARHAFVGGVLVDASAARFVPVDRALVSGGLVEVHGTMTGAVLMASRVDFPVPGRLTLGGATGEASRYATEFEIDGPILSSVDAVKHTFEMRGPTAVDYSTAQFLAGSAADLARGRQVVVQGAPSADGTRLMATAIRILQ